VRTNTLEPLVRTTPTLARIAETARRDARIDILEAVRAE